ncbi:hypothetical protein [Prolixibacter denitrificans]|uniref:Uncharacterized protein n=1 Tax=Prolixibacter denitrificans TaxID=1541063 RepID=A0A2P8C800_9BACT|nr:hypothetical protein [Prolixibacter denitrificans]PSK81098.1 hypothetical protein CLV93_11175 [Prolixibacter denitrificans]GET22215.1 hypothetical protein JCM18694_24610 [Prolixibacter denitrificans]
MTILNFNLPALISVMGTMLVILGALLGHLTQMGKVKIYQNSVNIKFYEKSDTGNLNEKNQLTKITHSIIITIELDFYNTSPGLNKIVRRLKFLTKSKGRNNYFDLLSQDSRKGNHGVIKADELTTINLAPNELLNHSLYFTIHKDFENFIESEWFIEYRDNKDKIRRIKIER